MLKKPHVVVHRLSGASDATAMHIQTDCWGGLAVFWDAADLALVVERRGVSWFMLRGVPLWRVPVGLA